MNYTDFINEITKNCLPDREFVRILVTLDYDLYWRHWHLLPFLGRLWLIWVLITLASMLLLSLINLKRIFPHPLQPKPDPLDKYEKPIYILYAITFCIEIVFLLFFSPLTYYQVFCTITYCFWFTRYLILFLLVTGILSISERFTRIK
jgi:hypothetical protein